MTEEAGLKGIPEMVRGKFQLIEVRYIFAEKVGVSETAILESHSASNEKSRIDPEQQRNQEKDIPEEVHTIPALEGIAEVSHAQGSDAEQGQS